ncbi:hypothetical protein PBRA_001537 [Plasmodiophora brassicae]|uniref:von Hippel-Lindau disease tumour suppressor beta domain-containing protein n=1 Tax=Plasmodiophora brassicae TaxID=37360 RepID=A0A0G4IYP2_PLABS|nr:hypothetical protein PBRA_001537 [Plasmodiophora brassicae]
MTTETPAETHKNDVVQRRSGSTIPIRAVVAIVVIAVAISFVIVPLYDRFVKGAGEHPTVSQEGNVAVSLGNDRYEALEAEVSASDEPPEVTIYLHALPGAGATQYVFQSDASSDASTSNAGTFVPVAITCINVHNETIEMFWKNYNGEEISMGTIAPYASKLFNSYATHIWVWRVASSQEFIKETALGTEGEVTLYSSIETSWHETYEKEHGYPWLNVYPRGPLSKWVPDPVAIGHEDKREVGPAHCTNEGEAGSPDSKVNVTLLTVSTSPKVFVVDNFASELECDHIIAQALASGNLHRSVVKNIGEVSDARTSENTWVAPTESKIIENLFRRGYDLLKLNYSSDSWNVHAEKLQVLRYQVGQESK